jgi:hypothetical protein
MAKQYTKISMSMRPALLKRVDRAAETLQLTRSEFLQRVVESYLDESELQVKALADPVVRAAFLQAMMTPGVPKAMAAALGEELSPDQQQQLFEMLGSPAKKGKKR